MAIQIQFQYIRDIDKIISVLNNIGEEGRRDLGRGARTQLITLCEILVGPLEKGRVRAPLKVFHGCAFLSPVDNHFKKKARLVAFKDAVQDIEVVYRFSSLPTLSKEEKVTLKKNAWKAFNSPGFVYEAQDETQA